ncbi:MAG: CPBP family glutamic-type intramembrane protease [Candidatus Thorarchaeota archaeon]|jgi:hypothetical protein
MSRRRRSSQEVDVEASFSIEEEGVEKGYYIGIIGALLKYTMTIMGGLLLVATQSIPEISFFVLMIVVFYVLGWIMTREAGMETLPTYRTVLDVLGYGMILGFLIRAVEGIVLVFTAGVAELDLLGPLGALVNSALGTNSTVMIAVGLIFASVAEEMLHRGGMIYLCNLLQDKYGMSEMIAQIFSCIVQAFFFAVLHVCIVAHLTVNLTVFWPFLGQWAVENPAIALILGLVVGGLYYLFSLRGGGEDEI